MPRKTIREGEVIDVVDVEFPRRAIYVHINPNSNAVLMNPHLS